MSPRLYITAYKGGAIMKEYFNTKEEAEAYKEKRQLFPYAAEYIAVRNKWALVFPLPTTTAEERKTFK